MQQKIRFARVGKNQFQKLLDLRIGKRFIEPQQIEGVKKILKLEGKNILDLRRVRNTIVRDFTKNNRSEIEDCWNTMSGVTAVIEDMIYRQGGIL